jgi:hypothetical protein
MENFFLKSSDGRSKVEFQKVDKSTQLVFCSTVLVGDDGENKLELSVIIPIPLLEVRHCLEIFLHDVRSSILDVEFKKQTIAIDRGIWKMNIIEAPNFISSTDKRLCEILLDFEPRCAYRTILLLDVTVIEKFLQLE